MNCNGCREEVIPDGHGELIHAESFKYGCEPKASKGGPYPVAH